MLKWIGAFSLVTAALCAPLAPAIARQAESARVIVVQNDCQRAIKIFVYHTEEPGKWKAGGWQAIGPGATRSIAGEGIFPISLMQLPKQKLYFYAETTDDGIKKYWRGGGPEVTFRGTTYQMREAVRNAEIPMYYSFRLHCN